MVDFRYDFKISWAHIDANMHVGNTHYNLLATDARVAFLLASGYQFGVNYAVGPVVLRDEVAYLKELHYGDVGTVELQLAGLSPDNGRWKIRHILRRGNQNGIANQSASPNQDGNAGDHMGGDVCCTVESLGGWIDLKTRKLVVPQGIFVEAFSSLKKSDDFQELKSLRLSK